MPDPLAAVIRIHPADDVVIARHQLLGGTRLAQEGVTVSGLVPPGHKVAVRAIAAGAPVRRYNQIIGTATVAIQPGQQLQSDNWRSTRPDPRSAVASPWRCRADRQYRHRHGDP